VEGDARVGPRTPGLVRKLVLATWPGRALRWWSTSSRNGWRRSRIRAHRDVTDDVPRKAGIMRATALVAAINTDAENVYVTLSARALRLDFVIVARARTEASEPKLRRAGATRVMNPQRIGSQRITAAALRPNVVEFLDVVMHDGSLEFRLEEVTVRAGSRLAGRTLRGGECGRADRRAVLALRGRDGTFLANPLMQTRSTPGTC
jgi:voltage-gated potassium channel